MARVGQQAIGRLHPVIEIGGWTNSDNTADTRIRRSSNDRQRPAGTEPGEPDPVNIITLIELVHSSLDVLEPTTQREITLGRATAAERECERNPAQFCRDSVGQVVVRAPRVEIPIGA